MAKKKINSRTKGQTAERKLVKLFEAWWGSKFFRTPGSGAFATRGFMSVDTTDMAGDIVTPDKTFPFCVESKKVEGWTLEQLLTSQVTKLHSWWEQTVRESPEGRTPLLVFTKNHAPLYVMMRAKDAPVEAWEAGFRYYMKEELVSIFALDYLFATAPKEWLQNTQIAVHEEPV